MTSAELANLGAFPLTVSCPASRARFGDLVAWSILGGWRRVTWRSGIGQRSP